jgi:predicted RNase H-like HicB family nuclease
MKTKYIVALEPGTEKTAWGVAVPDLPGCFSAGDSLEEALANTPEAIHAWLSVADNMPQRLSIESHIENVEYDGWLWATVDVEFEDECSLSEETIRSLGITEWNPSDYMDSVEGCAAYLREVASPSNQLSDRVLLEDVSHIWHSSGYQHWAASKDLGSSMAIDAHQAVIRYDDKRGNFHGKFLDLPGVPDFYAETVTALKNEGTNALATYRAERSSVTDHK